MNNISYSNTNINDKISNKNSNECEISINKERLKTKLQLRKHKLQERFKDSNKASRLTSVFGQKIINSNIRNSDELLNRELELIKKSKEESDSFDNSTDNHCSTENKIERYLYNKTTLKEQTAIEELLRNIEIEKLPHVIDLYCSNEIVILEILKCVLNNLVSFQEEKEKYEFEFESHTFFEMITSIQDYYSKEISNGLDFEIKKSIGEYKQNNPFNNNENIYHELSNTVIYSFCNKMLVISKILNILEVCVDILPEFYKFFSNFYINSLINNCFIKNQLRLDQQQQESINYYYNKYSKHQNGNDYYQNDFMIEQIIEDKEISHKILSNTDNEEDISPLLIYEYSDSLLKHSILKLLFNIVNVKNDSAAQRFISQSNLFQDSNILVLLSYTLFSNNNYCYKDNETIKKLRILSQEEAGFILYYAEEYKITNKSLEVFIDQNYSSIISLFLQNYQYQGFMLLINIFTFYDEFCVRLIEDKDFIFSLFTLIDRLSNKDDSDVISNIFNFLALCLSTHLNVSTVFLDNNDIIFLILKKIKIEIMSYETNSKLINNGFYLFYNYLITNNMRNINIIIKQYNIIDYFNLIVNKNLKKCYGEVLKNIELILETSNRDYYVFKELMRVDLFSSLMTICNTNDMDCVLSVLNIFKNLERVAALYDNSIIRNLMEIDFYFSAHKFTLSNDKNIKQIAMDLCNSIEGNY